MNKLHQYNIHTLWTGNTGVGTKSYASYDRSHNIYSADKKIIECSSDPSFRGDATKYNPEELFLASISACHMLWYLHLCADNAITVINYIDNAIGKMEQDKPGGKFVQVMLRPKIEIKEAGKKILAMELHKQAHEQCFIANSCNFPILHEPEIKIVESI